MKTPKSQTKPTKNPEKLNNKKPQNKRDHKPSKESTCLDKGNNCCSGNRKAQINSPIWGAERTCVILCREVGPLPIPQTPLRAKPCFSKQWKKLPFILWSYKKQSKIIIGVAIKEDKCQQSQWKSGIMSCQNPPTFKKCKLYILYVWMRHRQFLVLCFYQALPGRKQYLKLMLLIWKIREWIVLIPTSLARSSSFHS